MKALAEENALLRDQVRSLRDQLFARERELTAQSRPSPANPFPSMPKQLVYERTKPTDTTIGAERERGGEWSQSLNLMDLSFTMGQTMTLAELFRGRPNSSENLSIVGVWGELVW